MSADTYSPPHATLNTGAKVSMVALGCFNDKDPNGIVPGIEAATKVGYTHFDTATFYQNENAVGATLRASRIPRKSLFVTTKLSNFDHHRVEEAFDKSLNELGSVSYTHLTLPTKRIV